MSYFGKPPVQVFMTEINKETSSDVEGRYREKEKKEGKRKKSLTLGQIIFEKILSIKNLKKKKIKKSQN